MKCFNCNLEYDPQNPQCPRCGAPHYPPQYQNYAPQQVYNEAYVPCEHCGGKMLPQTATEMRKRSIFTIIWWIFLTVISFGIIPIISLIRGRKSRTVTYMVCQRCGHRVDSKRLKAWKR